jgi:hypothetical protein
MFGAALWRQFDQLFKSQPVFVFPILKSQMKFDPPVSVRVFLAVFGFVGVVLPLTTMWMLQPLSGDLTRIGRLPESRFGWNRPQPVFEQALATVTSPAQAKILVLGDSYSINGVWQHAAFGDAVRFATLRSSGALCQDFSDTLIKLGASPQLLVLQISERHLIDRMPPGCLKSGFRWWAPEAQARTSAALRDRFWIFGGAFGYRYVMDALRFMLNAEPQHREGAYGGVQVKEVPQGCQYFSHAECGLGLFLGWDFTKQPIKEGLRTATQDGLNAAMRAAPTVLLVVVPSKASIYLETRADAKRKDAELVALASGQSLVVLPLFERFHAAARQMQDFYLPNDTHLSPSGEAQLGRHIKSALVASRPELLAAE